MTSTLDITDGIALITLDSGKVNAVNEDVLDQLNHQLDIAEKDAKVLVIYGGEGKFCGGFDLSVINGSDLEMRDRLVIRGSELVKRLYSFPIPVIIAADGHGIALGSFILLAADYRIGVKQGKYGLNETAIGLLIPEWGLKLAKDRMNPTKLTESLVLSRIYVGEQAIEPGFLDQAVAQGETLSIALDYASSLSQLPSETVHQIKLKLRANALA